MIVRRLSKSWTTNQWTSAGGGDLGGARGWLRVTVPIAAPPVRAARRSEAPVDRNCTREPYRPLLCGPIKRAGTDAPSHREPPLLGTPAPINQLYLPMVLRYLQYLLESLTRPLITKPPVPLQHCPGGHGRSCPAEHIHELFNFTGNWLVGQVQVREDMRIATVYRLIFLS